MSISVLTVLRSETGGGEPEAEMVSVDRQGDRVILTLDDGVVINAHAGELAVAVVDLAAPTLRAA
jgi:hypothetical protein